MRAAFLDDAQKLYAKRLNAAFLILTLILMAALYSAVLLWIGKAMGHDEYERLHEVRHTVTLPVQSTLQVPEGECREIQKMRDRLAKIRGRG